MRLKWSDAQHVDRPPAYTCWRIGAACKLAATDRALEGRSGIDCHLHEGAPAKHAHDRVSAQAAVLSEERHGAPL